MFGWLRSEAKQVVGAAERAARERARRPAPGGRLQVGCGASPIAGWINVDVQQLPGVDLVLDVREGIPFRDLAAIFAEHFLEHLTVEEALDFLGEARAALASDGRIRLSTPNLEWVWASHDPRGGENAERQRKALVANRAFYGWEHRFLWTEPLLAEALAASGFVGVRFCAYGESEEPELAGLERHERCPDAPDLPHVLIVEAARGERQPKRLARLRELLRDEFLGHLRG